MHPPTRATDRDTERDIAAGSAAEQGELWSADAEAWAAQEEQQAAIYAHVLAAVGCAPGTRLLDVGCGSGVALRIAADRDARTSGIDASPALIAVAQQRVPEAHVQVGDLQFLPHPDAAFDVVTGFNSFQFAADMLAALRESARVVRRGGAIAIQVWGRPERCDLVAAIRAVAPFLPFSLPSGPDGRDLCEPGVLEALAQAAGLEPGDAGDITTAFRYPDDAGLLRAMRSAGLIALAARCAGEAQVAAAILTALAPFRASDGSYRVENEWHYLVAAA